MLQSVCACAESNQERDILLIGSIVTLSAVLPNVYGNYSGDKVFPNLILFVPGSASEGKGRLKHCKKLAQLVHEQKKEETKLAREAYDIAMVEYNSKKKNISAQTKPINPKVKMLFIPANNSATGFFNYLVKMTE